MPAQNSVLEGPNYTGLATGTALGRAARVMLNSSSQILVATIGVVGLGHTKHPIAANERGIVRLHNAAGEQEFIGNGALAIGDPLYTAGAGKCGATATGARFIGTVTLATAADGDIGKYIPGRHSPAEA